MAELFGEDDNGTSRCPGDGNCDIWDAAGGAYEERAAACLDCKRCGGKAPPNPDAETEASEPGWDEDEVADILFDIEDIAAWEAAGQRTNWDVYEWNYRLYYRWWVETENRFRQIQQVRFHQHVEAYVKAKFKNPSPF